MARLSLKTVSIVITAFAATASPAAADCLAYIGASGVADEATEQHVARGIVACDPGLAPVDGQPQPAGPICEQGPMISLKESAPADTYVVRYNVDVPESQFPNRHGGAMNVHARIFLGDTENNQVIVHFVEYSVTDNTVHRTLLSLDTAEETNEQGKFVTITDQISDFGAGSNYYFEVHLVDGAAPPLGQQSVESLSGPALAWIAFCGGFDVE